MNKSLKTFFKKSAPVKIFSYDEFQKHSEEKLKQSDSLELSGLAKKRFEYSKLNLYRTKRIQKSYKTNDELEKLVSKIDCRIVWLIITEDWCGDSAQNLPYFMRYAELNDNIIVHVILRDENIEAIDNYFHEGNPRSIPKIVGFSENGRELFVWGPRPKYAQDKVMKWKSKGDTSEEFNQKLHLWYAKNRGAELEKEMKLIFQNLIKD